MQGVDRVYIDRIIYIYHCSNAHRGASNLGESATLLCQALQHSEAADSFTGQAGRALSCGMGCSADACL